MGRSRYLLFSLATLVTLLSGCAGQLPFFAKSPDDLDPSSSSSGLARNDHQNGFTVTPLGEFPQEEKPGVAGAFAAAVKNAGQSVGKALRIEPKVIPAEDPTKMSSDPGRIDPRLYVTAGQIHEQRGDFEAARKKYQRALDIDPNHLEALLSSARVNDRLEHFDEAAGIYQQAIATHPTSAVAVNDLALCCARRGRLDQSIELLQRAVQLQPSKKLYRNNLARVLIEVGQVREAFEQLVAVYPPASAHYNLGFFFYQRKQQQEAVRHFAQAVEMDPSLTGAKRMLQQLSAKPALNHQSQSVDDGSREVQAAAMLSHAQHTGRTEVQHAAGEIEPVQPTATSLDEISNNELRVGQPHAPLQAVPTGETEAVAESSQVFDYFQGVKEVDRPAVATESSPTSPSY